MVNQLEMNMRMVQLSALISKVADEIEFRPGDNPESQNQLIKEDTAIVDGKCLAKWGTGHYMRSRIVISTSKDEVHLMSEENAAGEETILKRVSLEFTQCLLVPSLLRDNRTGDLEDCILLVQPQAVTYSILFEKSADASKWHREILRRQGYLEKPITQYTHSIKLSEGLYGRIFLSRHKNSECDYAIKVMDKAYMVKTFADMGEQYAEIEVLKRVCRGQATNMLELVDYFEDSKHFYAVTKYMPDGDLQNFIIDNWRTEAMPEDIAKVIIRQLVKAVKQLHEKNILHRDIKEANVLITIKDDKPHVSLADFGISSQLESKTATRDYRIGT